MRAVADVEETRLPGVGVRYAFTTAGGDRIGVIAHRGGKRELLVYSRYDPDSCSAVLGLGDDDARTLVDLLGGSELSERLDDTIRQSIEGLTLEWVEIQPSSPSVGVAIADLGLRTRTGASLVAVVRQGETITSPRADFRLASGDTAVLVGSAPAVAAAKAILPGG
jgi:TrkA domain protein